MSTCTDLFNAINAIVVDPNLLVSVAPSDIAVLSNIGTTESIVQLTTGGNALLSVPASPAIDGQLFRVVIAGRLFNARASSTSGNLRVYKGTSIDSLYKIAEPSFAIPADSEFEDPYLAFYFDATILWSSVYQTYFGHNKFLIGGTGGSVTVNGVPPRAAASQTDLKFFLTAQFTQADAGNSLTVTQFTIKKI